MVYHQVNIVRGFYIIVENTTTNMTFFVTWWFCFSGASSTIKLNSLLIVAKDDLVRFIRFILIMLLLHSVAFAVSAQETTFISLNTETTALQTGQEYIVTILAENVTDLWGAELSIRYDPTILYVIGTESGSPVTTGNFIGDAPTLVVENGVGGGLVDFTIARLGREVEPVSGTGAVGTFRIYPLAPGTTQLTFANASLQSIIEEANGDRAGQSIEFTPVLLEVTVTGDPVDPPPEVTATPPPTATPINAEFTAEPEATELVNVTRAPTEQPQIENEPPAETSGMTFGLLEVAIGLVVVGIIGLFVLVVLARGSRKKK